jgi:hypothetical protein
MEKWAENLKLWVLLIFSFEHFQKWELCLFIFWAIFSNCMQKPTSSFQLNLVNCIHAFIHLFIHSLSMDLYSVQPGCGNGPYIRNNP